VCDLSVARWIEGNQGFTCAEASGIAARSGGVEL